MLQNAKVTAFTVSELLGQNPQGGLPSTQIGVKNSYFFIYSAFVSQLITYYNLMLPRISLCSVLLILETFHYNLCHWKTLITNIE